MSPSATIRILRFILEFVSAPPCQKPAREQGLLSSRSVGEVPRHFTGILTRVALPDGRLLTHPTVALSAFEINLGHSLSDAATKLNHLHVVGVNGVSVQY